MSLCRKLALGLLVCASLLFCAPLKSYGFSVLTKNTVVFSSSKSFIEQVKGVGEGTVIIVKDDFDLQKTTVSIPRNCTLRFEGGSLSDGTVVFQKTRIDGYPVMDVIPQGTISGTVNAGWFGLRDGDANFDNSVILNRVGQVFSNLYVEAGDFYCKTPIDWSNNIIKCLTVDGNLRFKTANTSDTFITLKTTRGVVSFNGTIIGPTQKITGKTPKEKSVGICFKDCNNSKIFVKSIGMFYKNIQVLGSSDAKGNAYNDYEFIESYSAKILVHIDADKGGWATSNIYRILRLTGYGGQTEPETALLIQGENTSKSGNFSDTVIEKLCIEGLKQSEPIKIVGANHFVIRNIRNEANYPVLCYCENVVDGFIDTNYGSVTVSANNTSNVGITTEGQLCEYEPLKESYMIDSDGRYRLFNCVDSGLNAFVRYSPLSYTPVGMLVSAAVLNRPLQIQSSDPFTLDVVYYDKEMKVISNSESNRLMPAGNIYFRKSNVLNSSGYMSSSATRDLKFVCPGGNPDVAFVGLFFRSHGTTPSPVFYVSKVIMSSAVSSVMGKQKHKSYLSSGSSKGRPKFDAADIPYRIGYPYFDTTLGKTIYVKSISKDGTATWVDASGKQM